MNTGPEVLRFGDYSDPSPGSVRFSARVNEATTRDSQTLPAISLHGSPVEIQTMHNVATCRWGSEMPGQPFHYTGTDFLEECDGRVSRLYIH